MYSLLRTSPSLPLLLILGIMAGADRGDAPQHEHSFHLCCTSHPLTSVPEGADLTSYQYTISGDAVSMRSKAIAHY